MERGTPSYQEDRARLVIEGGQPVLLASLRVGLVNSPAAIEQIKVAAVLATKAVDIHRARAAAAAAAA